MTKMQRFAETYFGRDLFEEFVRLRVDLMDVEAKHMYSVNKCEVLEEFTFFCIDNGSAPSPPRSIERHLAAVGVDRRTKVVDGDEEDHFFGLRWKLRDAEKDTKKDTRDSGHAGTAKVTAREANLMRSYSHSYDGRELFELFVLHFVELVDVPEPSKKLYLITKTCFLETLARFCTQLGFTPPSSVNVGRHFSAVGVAANTKIGPAGAQERCYSGVRWKVRDLGGTKAKETARNAVENAVCVPRAKATRPTPEYQEEPVQKKRTGPKRCLEESLSSSSSSDTDEDYEEPVRRRKTRTVKKKRAGPKRLLDPDLSSLSDSDEDPEWRPIKKKKY